MRTDHSRRRPFFACLIAAAGPLVAAGFSAAQGSATKSTPASPPPSIRSVDDRVRIEPYKGPPIYLDEKQVVVAPSIVNRDVVSDKFPDGSLRVERVIAKYSDDHFDSDGYYHEFHPGGKKFIEGQFRDGRREGEWTYWFDNGQLNRKVTYRNGQLNGQWDVFRADGTLAAKHSFADGLRDGTWVIYDDAGKQPLRLEAYSMGKADGIWKTWFPNGQLQLQASFKQNVRHGTITQWKEDGSTLSESNWADGKLNGTTTRWQDGAKTIQEYKDGLLVSEKKGLL